jgi:hypothetical protein
VCRLRPLRVKAGVAIHVANRRKGGAGTVLQRASGVDVRL